VRSKAACALVRRDYDILEIRITVCLWLDDANTPRQVLPPIISAQAELKSMKIINVRYCLSMARSLDAEAARTTDDSYLRKLLEEQAAKYRADAEITDTAPTRPA
jgi:hypothetical protein